jgi:hypothetical protein
MKTYVITSGTIFALLALAHVGRIVGERASLLKEPFFLLITLAAATMAVWAWRVFVQMKRAPSGGPGR